MLYDRKGAVWIFICPFLGDITRLMFELTTLTLPAFPGSDPRWDWGGQSGQLENKPRNVPKRTTNHLPQYSSPVQLTPNGPRRPRTASERLIMRPLAPSRPAYTPWGYCDRLGWSVVTCGCHPQPSRRPRALKVEQPPSGQICGKRCPNREQGRSTWVCCGQGVP